jgi:type VI secretion system secreted protein Hcp
MRAARWTLLKRWNDMAQSDMFLKIDGNRQGAIKGEAQDAAHRDEIDVLGWHWGMEGNQVHGQDSTKVSVHELRVSKQVDKASTALLSALRSNEVIKKAVLTVRKAGKDKLEYYTVTMERGRITAVKQVCGESAEPSFLKEEVGIAFSKFKIEYTPQGADGQKRGSTGFEMDILEKS